MNEAVDESFVNKYREKQGAEYFINWNDVSQTEHKKYTGLAIDDCFTFGT